MPPLPTSLIVIGLVAAWLVVLVPMVAKRRERVPESDEDSAGFRVLHRASQSLRRRRPVLSRTAMAERAGEEYDDRYGGDDRYGDGDDLFDEDVGDDVVGDESSEESWSRAEVAEEMAVPAAEEEPGLVDEDRAGMRSDEFDAEVLDRRSGSERGSGERVLPGRSTRRPQRAARPRRAPVAAAEQPMLDERWGDADEDRHRVDVRDAADEWAVEHEDRRGIDEAPDARGRSGGPRWQADPEWDEGDRVDSWDRADSWDRSDDQGWERTAEDGWDGAREPARGRRYGRQEEARMRPVPIRPGRGGFDPRAAEQAKAYRYRQRRRVVLVLLALAVAGAGLGVLGFGMAWAVAGVATVLLALYLAYLRRQVRIEESIRQRRAARLERARQIRPVYRASVAEQVRAHRTGSLPRPDVDEEPVGRYQVRSHARPTVPPALHTRGVPVDLDDDDPAFDDLEYYRPVTYRRAVGE